MPKIELSSQWTCEEIAQLKAQLPNCVIEV